jgi:hypothetical protein
VKALLVCLCLGCAVETSSPPPQLANKRAEPSKAAAPAKAAAPQPEAEPEAEPEEKAAPEPEPADKPEEKAGPEPEPEAPDRTAEQPGVADLSKARKYQDPAWFRKTLFPDGKMTKSSRSEADDKGLFQSLMTFDLPEGTTEEACAAHLEKVIGKDVSNLERITGENDRIELRGSAERYDVVCVCGKGKSAMVGFVSYRWTS